MCLTTKWLIQKPEYYTPPLLLKLQTKQKLNLCPNPSTMFVCISLQLLPHPPFSPASASALSSYFFLLGLHNPRNFACRHTIFLPPDSACPPNSAKSPPSSAQYPPTSACHYFLLYFLQLLKIPTSSCFSSMANFYNVLHPRGLLLYFNWNCQFFPSFSSNAQ